MNDVTLTLAQTKYSLRGFLRNPSGMVFTVVMPVLLLFLFNAIFRGNTQFSGLNVPFPTFYTASIIAYQIMQASFSSLLISVTTDREGGLLKRFRGTPMPRWVYLVAEIGKTIVITIVTLVVLVAVGSIFYHVKLSGHTLVGLAVYMVVGTSCFCSLGLAVTRVCATTDAATAIGPFSTVILAFLSGVYIPVAIMPRWLLDVGKVFPLEHLARGLQTAFLVPGSTGITAVNIGVLVAWGAGGLILAARTFRWEPLAAGT